MAKSEGLRFPRFTYAVAFIVFGVLTGLLGSTFLDVAGQRPATLWSIVGFVALGTFTLWGLVLTVVSAVCVFFPRVGQKL